MTSLDQSEASVHLVILAPGSEEGEGLPLIVPGLLAASHQLLAVEHLRGEGHDVLVTPASSSLSSLSSSLPSSSPVVLTQHDLGGPVRGVEVVEPLQQRHAQPLVPGQVRGDHWLQLHVVTSQHLVIIIVIIIMMVSFSSIQILWDHHCKCKIPFLSNFK